MCMSQPFRQLKQEFDLNIRMFLQQIQNPLSLDLYQRAFLIGYYCCGSRLLLEEGDPYELTDRMEAVYAMMPDPKEYHTFPEDVHGTRMFKTPSGDEFRQLLVDFLESFAE